MTVIAAEIERFIRLSTTWWNRNRPMRPLHGVNALRLNCIVGRIEAHWGLDQTDPRGIPYLPWLHRASWIRDPQVNPIAASVKGSQ